MANGQAVLAANPHIATTKPTMTNPWSSFLAFDRKGQGRC
jgi:hypothetical protein